MAAMQAKPSAAQNHPSTTAAAAGDQTVITAKTPAKAKPATSKDLPKDPDGQPIGHNLTLAQKKAVLALIDAGKTQSSISKLYHKTEAAISLIKKTRKDIEAEIHKASFDQDKKAQATTRIKSAQFPILEECLFRKYLALRENKVQFCSSG